ncbi:MAG TPA: PIN domain-containing protein [Polyangiaceae bacterium]|nr:PIN domain-containing protein [Polyangiaceae bacterium]
MRPVVYDAGVLIAAERNERRVWAEHRVRLDAGLVPVVSACVVAQASRSPKQAQMRRLLRGCEVVPFDENLAHRAGALLGKARTADVVDASVVALAVARGADILSGDLRDLRKLIATARAGTSVREV